MTRKILKPTHPAAVAFNKLVEAADDMGIQIDHTRWGEMLVTYEGKTYNVRDSDTRSESPREFPPREEIEMYYTVEE
jgi:hypothetical protein